MPDDIIYTLPPRYSKMIFKLSHFMLPNILYTYHLGLYILCAIALGGFITSINYWHCPRYDWRRNVDIVWINLGMVYHLYSALKIPHRHLIAVYYSGVMISLLCYFRSRYWSQRKNPHFAAYWHMATHVFGVSFNTLLYHSLRSEYF
jgi:hypothetical protein